MVLPCLACSDGAAYDTSNASTDGWQHSQTVMPTFAKASVGWESYQADVGHTMYVDDVVLDDTAVGCPTA